MSGWLTLTTRISFARFVFPPRANPHHSCIASISVAKACVPEALAIFPWAFLCVSMTHTAFRHCYLFILGFFFFFFPEAMDVLGPGGCGGFNSCDCRCAPQDLRATSSNQHAHAYTYTCKHSESRFKSEETHTKKCRFLSRSGRKMALVRHPRNKTRLT